MKRLLIVCAAMLSLAWAAVSCADPITIDIPNPNQGQEMVKPAPATDSITIIVTLEQETATKTSLNGNAVVWSAGDKIKVFNATHPEGEEFTLTDASSGKFTGKVVSGDGPFYAVYPASAAGTLSGEVISLTVPAKQSYAANSFGLGANFSGGKTASLSSGFTFRNFFGLLKLQIQGSATVDSVVVYSKNSSDVLNGSFSLSFNETGVPVTTTGTGQPTAINQKLKLDCGSSGVALGSEAKPFYLVVPAGMLNDGMMVEMVVHEGDDDGAMVLNTGAYTSKEGQPYFINRSHIRPMAAISYSKQYDAAFLENDLASAAYTDTTNATTKVCSYDQSTGQYAFLNSETNRVMRFSDWTSGFSCKLTTPKELVMGAKIDLTVEAYGLDPDVSGSYTGENQARVIKVTKDRAWITTPDGKGFIMMMLED